MKPTILIAEDHAVVLEGFRKLLGPSYEIIGAVTDGQALVKALDDLAPDVILVDLAMPRLNGLDAIERVKARRPRSRLIVLTMQEDSDTAAEAMRRGAMAYVLKSSAPSELFHAIEEVLHGRVFVSPAVSEEPPRVFATKATQGAKKKGLSLRQREVLQLLAEGKSMKEAADLLDLTPRTIAFHKYSMMEHLGLKTSAELIQYAITLGLVAQHRNRP
jgi:DNA-binding NarL/FixJ family response regulator